MRKKILLGIFALTVMVATGYGVNRSMNNDIILSELGLLNIEAMANGELNPPNVIPCYSNYRVTPVTIDEYEPIWTITDCNGCKNVECFEFSGDGTCTKDNGGWIWI